MVPHHCKNVTPERPPAPEEIPAKYRTMKYLIRLQREGWYFAGFNGQSRSAKIGKLQDAKIYGSKREAMNDLTRLGNYGQRIIAITQLGNINDNGRTPNQTSLQGRKAKESESQL